MESRSAVASRGIAKSHRPWRLNEAATSSSLDRTRPRSDLRARPLFDRLHRSSSERSRKRQCERASSRRNRERDRLPPGVPRAMRRCARSSTSIMRAFGVSYERSAAAGKTPTGASPRQRRLAHQDTCRRRAPPGGPRGSPRRPATGRGACRRPKRPLDWRSGSRPSLAFTLPRGSSSRPSSSIMPSCTGETKPMASSTRSAFSSNSVPGTGLKRCVDARAVQPLHAAVAAGKAASSAPRNRARRLPPGSTRCGASAASSAR